MFDLGIWLFGLAAIVPFSAMGWLLSLLRRDVSIVDIMWSMMFLLAALAYVWPSTSHGARVWLVLTLVAVWSARLATYIAWRNRGRGEDFRYRRIRANNEPGFAYKSAYLVFGFQARLAWVISMPVLAAINSTTALGWLDAAGVTLWLIGMVFETGADWQLARFKTDPTNRDKVLDTGLWRYTRHPNYFGDFCIWWGLFLIALAGGGWWSLASPLLMSYLLLAVSGVALLERDIGERRPAYLAYMRQTSSFSPWPPRGI